MQRPKVVPSLGSHLGFDWSNVTSAFSDIAKDYATYERGLYAQPIPYQYQQSAFGGSTGMLVLVGVLGLGAYYLVTRRRR